MPIYSFRNKETEEEFELEMSNSAREAYLKENPKIEQLLTKINLSHVTNTLKTDNVFRDRLKKIHQSNPGSFINTGNIGEV